MNSKRQGSQIETFMVWIGIVAWRISSCGKRKISGLCCWVINSALPGRIKPGNESSNPVDLNNEVKINWRDLK
jgi:hypothetical protein